MKKLLLLTIAIVFFALPASAQTTFPERCLGVWAGKMLIYKEGAVKDSVDVRLTVARTKTPGDYTWRTDYLSKERPMTKDYTLRVKDAAKGHYLTDEGGGVELHEYVFGDKMYDVFETGGVMLTATYEIRGKELIFEVSILEIV